MTRGREDNTAHLVAENLDEARSRGLRRSAATAPTSGPPTPPNAPPGQPRPLRPPPSPRSRAGRPACRLGRSARPASRPARYQHRHVLMAEIGEPDPYWVADLNTQIDEHVTWSPPPPTRCTPSSTNPPSDPYPRAGSTKSTPTGSRTDEPHNNAQPKPTATGSTTPDPATTNSPTTTTARLTQAEASADEPHHRSPPKKFGHGEPSGEPSGEENGEPPAAQLIARRPYQVLVYAAEIVWPDQPAPTPRRRT